MRSNDNLRAEYLLIQQQYEAFDQRALSLKGIAAPVLGAGIGYGFKDGYWVMMIAVIVVAGCLWLLEGIWKSFQYCLTDRIKELEAWHRGELSDEIAPFQIFTSWGQVWDRYYRKPENLPPILVQPFVCLPYAPIILLALAACFAKIVAR